MVVHSRLDHVSNRRASLGDLVDSAVQVLFFEPLICLTERGLGGEGLLFVFFEVSDHLFGELRHDAFAVLSFILPPVLLNSTFWIVLFLDLHAIVDLPTVMIILPLLQDRVIDQLRVDLWLLAGTHVPQ